MTPRQPFPDLTRALALLGIAVVNVFVFSQPLFSDLIVAARGSPLDQAAIFIVTAFFMAKSYTLFAFMFGAGVGQQLDAAAAEGAGFGARHLRRMTGLLALGLLNAWLLFHGDILFVYGLLGLCLFLFRGLAAPALRRWAIVLYALRTGLLQDPDAPLWSRSRRVYLPLGVLISAWGAWQMLQGTSDIAPSFMWGVTLVTIGAPLSTLGYLGWIARWSRGPGSTLRAFLVRAGGGSLTAYLLQGLIMSLVFVGYGLGLYGMSSAVVVVLIAAAAAVLSLLFVGWWRRRYPLGPVETLLRHWVYLGERRSGG